MASRLADILQQEYKTKGLIGGAVSALGKSSREKSDIRNMLFGGSGLGSIVGRKVFGKGYSATDRSGKVSNVSGAISSGSSSVLQEISINGKIAAKNSMSLPRIAEQMNIMQKNIAKMVKLQGATPSTKADSYFSSAKFRENAYESTFNKNSRGTTPIAVNSKESGAGGILGLVSSLFGGLATKLLSFGSIVAGLVGTFAALGTLLMGTVKLIMSVVSMLPGGKLLIKGLKLGALAAGGLFAANALSESGNGNSQGSGFGSALAGTAAGIGGALAVGSAVSAGSKLITAGKATAEAISNARVASNPYVQMSGGTTDPKSKWGRFLKFLERKSPKLFAKVGARLATAGILATIPVVGWVAALLQLGLSIALAYEIYNLWREFTNDKSLQKENNSSSSTPEAMSFEDALIGAFAEALGLNQPTPTSPTPTVSNLPKAGTPEAVKQQSFLGGQQQTYATMGGGEFGPDMLAATGVNADQVDNTSPTKVSEPEIEQILATIRQKESGNNYGIKNYAWNQGQTASGAYQFTKPTWQSLTKKYGIGTEYEFAKDAPPNIQDEVARRYVKEILKEAGGDVSKVPLKWYTGNIKGEMSAKALAINKGNTAQAYQASWMKEFNKKGSQIAESSSSLAMASRTPAPSSGGNQTTNIIGGGSGNQSVVSASAASPYDTELARLLTQGMSA